jgi:hypothetical protein
MNTNELLDQLAEFQAQADYLELKRQELLSGVQVPAEVLSAQDAANKRRQQIASDLWSNQNAINAERSEYLAAVNEPALPPEYVAAMNAVRAERQRIMQECDLRLQAEQTKATALQAQIEKELQAKVSDVYRQVETRKSEINSEFSEKADAVKNNIDDLTKRIKDEVASAGQSVKGKMFHAVYVKGRVTWNTDMLDGMVIAFPALEKARKVGQPSVTIRKV